VTRRILRIRGGTKAVAACVVLITALATTGQPASAAVSLTFVRQVGQSGHATLYPWGLTTAPDGTILVTDYWNFRVARYSTNGSFVGDVVTTASKGTLPQQHLSPYGVATDPRNGDVYIGDVDAGATVDKYTASGTFIRAIGGLGSGTGKFQYPAYVAVNSQGRLYVVDSRQPNVEVFDPNGNFLFQFGNGSAPSRLATPRGIAIDVQDRVYIADNWNHRVAVYDASGTFLYKFGSSGTAPGQFGPNADLRGIAVDSVHGWVYVVDSALNVIDKFTTDGTFLLRWGSYGTTAGKFIEGGRGVTVDGAGNVWVADLADFRVQKFDPSGGFLAAYPSANEVPPLGGFNAPTDVAVAPDGSIYVTDQRNWRIEKFSANGTFLLAWGNRGGGNYGFDYARGIAVDPTDGDVLVADTDNAKLKRYTSNGTHVWTAGGSDSAIGRIKAYSLDVGPDGTIYFANEATPPDIVTLDPNGNLIRRWGTSGSGAGQFLFPRGIAVDADGTLWISDSRRSTGIVQHFTATGTYLGGFGAHGTAANQINQAGDVVVDANYVYVADTNANRVKIFTKSGTYVGSTPGGGTAPGRMLQPIGMEMTPAGRIYVAEQGGERIQEFSVTGS
jgi:DNA-binding beta-propeller fold protein YncE